MDQRASHLGQAKHLQSPDGHRELERSMEPLPLAGPSGHVTGVSAEGGALPAPTPLVLRSSRRHEVTATPNETVSDPSRHVDTRWAAYLEKHRGESAGGGPESAHAEAENAPPSSQSYPGLLDLEREISALRPRPSDPQAGPLRGNRSDTLSLLPDAAPSDTPPPPPAVARPSGWQRRDHGRGHLPRAAHEHQSPPPPPSRRGRISPRVEEEDELPTQAKQSVSLPPPGFLNRARSSILPPPPAQPQGSPYGSALPSSLPPPPVMPAGYAPSALPPLPLPPPMPREFAIPHSAEGGFGEREWTDAKYPDFRQANVDLSQDLPGAPPLPPPLPPLYGSHSPVAPQAPQMQGFQAQGSNPDSVRPLSASVNAPAQGRWTLPAGWLPVAGAGVMGATLTAMAFALPQKGQLLVDVSGQNWSQVAGVQIFLDGKLVCASSPCAVKLDADSEHQVRAEAPGYHPSPEATVTVANDSVTLHKIQLGASADTGVDVKTTLPDLQLYVDGRRVGSLPRKVMGLTPGEHTILVSGGPYFKSVERRITVKPNQLLSISDLEPTLVAGGLELTRGEYSDGATVLLDGQPISLPYSGKLEPGKSYQLMATRDGYQPFERTVEFSTTQPVVKFPVTLIPLTDEGDTEPSAERPKADETDGDTRVRASRSNSRRAVQTSAPKDSASHAENDSTAAAPAVAAAPSQAVVNIVTTPSVAVLLDGKPIGKTPKRVSVSPGKHSIVLMHNDERKRATISLEPGSNKTIKATF